MPVNHVAVSSSDNYIFPDGSIGTWTLFDDGSVVVTKSNWATRVVTTVEPVEHRVSDNAPIGPVITRHQTVPVVQPVNASASDA